MSAQVRYDDVEVGTEIPAREFSVQRWQLIQYAGASGDFNIIHWNERFATLVGLPDVIAHGMFTMATAGRLLTDWAGDPAAVVDYGVRFSAMVPVPDDDAGAADHRRHRRGEAPRQPRGRRRRRPAGGEQGAHPGAGRRPAGLIS